MVETKPKIKISVQDLSVSYGETQALRNVRLDIFEKEILGVIGPASSGKTSILR